MSEHSEPLARAGDKSKTLEEKLTEIGAYTEKGAQSAVKRLNRIREGLPAEKV